MLNISPNLLMVGNVSYLDDIFKPHLRRLIQASSFGYKQVAPMELNTKAGQNGLLNH